jgi:hypothetical protein
MLSTIEEHFAAITDERQQYKVKYPQPLKKWAKKN